MLIVPLCLALCYLSTSSACDITKVNECFSGLDNLERVVVLPDFFHSKNDSEAACSRIKQGKECAGDALDGCHAEIGQSKVLCSPEILSEFECLQKVMKLYPYECILHPQSRKGMTSCDEFKHDVGCAKKLTQANCEESAMAAVEKLSETHPEYRECSTGM